jgi:hypothetical protein
MRSSKSVRRSIALAEDQVTGVIVAFEKAWDELSHLAQRQRGKIWGLLEQLELGRKIHVRTSTTFDYAPACAT